MSMMSELADEVMKPVKKGLYITSAVLVIGGIAVAANSKAGRNFLSKVKDAATGTPSDAVENKTIDSNNVTDVELEAQPEIEHKKDVQEKNMIGENNV